MEKFKFRKLAPAALIAGLSVIALDGCSWHSFNPATSVTHDADTDAGSTKEILQNFPEATNIQVTHADDNPNYMSWDMPGDMFCMAIASATQNRGKNPGQLIGEPYCRPAING